MSEPAPVPYSHGVTLALLVMQKMGTEGILTSGTSEAQHTRERTPSSEATDCLLSSYHNKDQPAYKLI